MAWRIEFSDRARRQLRALSSNYQRRIGVALDRLPDAPAQADIKKLAGRQNEWRLRVGDYRVFLVFDNVAGLMTVERIVHRRDAY